MNRSRAAGALGLMVVSALLFGAQRTSADQYTDQIAADQQKQAQNSALLTQLKARIASDQAQIPQLQAAIAQLDAQITTTQAQIAAAQTVLDNVTASLNASKVRLAQQQAELAAQKKQLAKELVIIYELQQQSTPLKNLLASGNFNDFWNSVINGRRISDQESATVTQVQTVEHDIELSVALIGQQQSEQQTAVNALQATKNQLDAEQSTKQAALAKMQAEELASAAEQAQVEADNAALNNQVAQLNQEEAAAQAAAAQAGNGGGGGGTGQFIWPDSGPISQGFGCTQYAFEPYDPGCPYPHRFHNGIDIAGSCGNDIVAADSGTAYIEPWQGNGYGNYILIAHGNGWQTLYGHLAGFAISSGQGVGQGQLIGWEGTTGNSTGCHLHFGVNHNNQWVNPLAYLP